MSVVWSKWIVASLLCGCATALTLFHFIPEKKGVSKGEERKCTLPQLPDRVLIKGGRFQMGAGALYSEEGPAREVEVDDFWIDRYEVTNRKFGQFVDDTGYVTVGERKPSADLHPDIPKELLVSGSAVFTPPGEDGIGSSGWEFVEGATWKSPTGKEASIEDKMDFPVVHIAYEDAIAYAAWSGGYLPTESEWEYAARSGLDGAKFEWGDDASKRTERANTWQGIFPIVNTAEDGFVEAAPVGCYEANAFGLFDMTGNVWEWVEVSENPKHVGRLKGGSYLCSDNFCRRYRPAARHAQEKDFSASHVGFRIAYPANKNHEK